MKIGIIQSNFIPWRGYFAFINEVDLFVFHDDLQYTKGDWRNRNKIKTAKGPIWLSVPVSYKKTAQLICETQIDDSQKWRNKHINLFNANYCKAPFFNDAMAIFEEGLSAGDQTISQLNIRFVKLICSYLQITTVFAMSSDYAISDTKTERLIDLLIKVNATEYLSGPSAKNYLAEDLFRKNNIKLCYKTYDHLPYPQLWGAFEGNVSVLDLIANTGPEAKKFLKSQSPDMVVVE